MIWKMGYLCENYPVIVRPVGAKMSRRRDSTLGLEKVFRSQHLELPPPTTFTTEKCHQIAAIPLVLLAKRHHHLRRRLVDDGTSMVDCPEVLHPCRIGSAKGRIAQQLTFIMAFLCRDKKHDYELSVYQGRRAGYSSTCGCRHF